MKSPAAGSNSTARICWPWSRTNGPGPGCSWPSSGRWRFPGVKMADFLRHAVTNVRRPDRKEGEELIPMREFRKELREKMDSLRVDQEFARRYVNDGFSGGESKRAEILQMAMLRPKFAVLDETDSGLDVDAVRLASLSIAADRRPRNGNPDHHAPRTTLGVQSAALHPRDARRPDRGDGRAGTGDRTAQAGLRPRPRRPSRGPGRRSRVGDCSGNAG